MKKNLKDKKSLNIAMLGHKRIPSREGGIEIVVEELATRMVTLGHKVTCYNRSGHHVSGKDFDGGKRKAYKGVRLKSVLTLDKKGLAAMTASVSGAICAAFGKYDVVHGKLSDKRKRSNPVFVVINNFKNIFEAFYFRCRYSSFYLLSVACDEDERRQCFDTSTEYHLTDLKENLSLGKKVFRRFDRIIDENDNFSKMNRARDFRAKYKTNISEAEFLFLKQIYTEESALRKTCYRNNLENIILQDVTTCIENADIFLKRNLREKEYRCDYDLIRSLARIVALLMHPGIVTPTKIERCMQVAMTAKLNSGCL